VLVAMSASYPMSRHFLARASWSRVMTGYDKDSEVSLAGVGYRLIVLKNALSEGSARFLGVLFPLTDAHQRLAGRSEKADFFASGSKATRHEFFNTIVSDRSLTRLSGGR
jgi:hypothetical protein